MAAKIKEISGANPKRIPRARKPGRTALAARGRLKRGPPVLARSAGAPPPEWLLPVASNWIRKPPRIDVKFPILGFLMEGEMTGYDLKRRFRDPVGFFYRVSDGSLYPALTKLERDGLVTMRAQAHGRRASKLYAISAMGRERFRRMLREPAAPIFVQDEAQVKIYFAHHDPQAALEHLDRARRFDQAWAASLNRLLDDMNRRGENPFRIIVVEVGRAITQFKAELMRKLSARLAREIGAMATAAAKDLR